MQPRHALQAAAKQFGFDGTERSLEALESAFADYRFVESVKESPEGLEVVEAVIRDGFPILSPREAKAFIDDSLAGETFLTMPLGEESHAE
jgi:hypothetical protein